MVPASLQKHASSSTEENALLRPLSLLEAPAFSTMDLTISELFSKSAHSVHASGPHEACYPHKSALPALMQTALLPMVQHCDDCAAAGSNVDPYKERAMSGIVGGSTSLHSLVPSFLLCWLFRLCSTDLALRAAPHGADPAAFHMCAASLESSFVADSHNLCRVRPAARALCCTYQS